MAFKHLRGITSAFAMTSLCAAPAAAERTEIVNPGRAFAAERCPVVPAEAAASEFEAGVKEIGPLIAGLLAGVGGEVVKQGVNAVGDALDRISQEKGIVAEGSTFFFATRIRAQESPVMTAQATPKTACLVLYIEGQGKLDDMAQEPALRAALSDAVGPLGIAQPLDPTAPAGGGPAPAEAVLKTLRDHGVMAMPSLYVEARLIQLREGFVVRPVLVWYGRRLSRAPSNPAATELHVSLATPGAADLGTVFGAARLTLPRMTPGQAFAWPALRSSVSVIVAPRPTAGFVDTRIAAMNAAYSLVGTRRHELALAQRSADAASVNDKVKSTDETRAALATANGALQDANEASDSAVIAAGAFRSIDAGAVNAKVRFVVVRNANEFGQALARALKAQADGAGKAVTTAMTPEAPQPAFTAADTAYATALAALSGKQREYDAAVSSGDIASAARFADELLVLKAKLNEAAVASKRPVPYPNLF